MNQSEKTDAIAKAMVAVQQAIKPAPKTEQNPFFKSKYADLSGVWHACNEALTGNGIAVIQGGNMIDGHPVMVTTLLHTSGQWIAGAFPLVAVKPDPQAMGSAITYMRRYSLAAMVGVLTEDDDGEAAMKRDGGGSAGPKRKEEAAGTPPADSPPPALSSWYASAISAIRAAREVSDLVQWRDANKAALQKLESKYRAQYDTLMAEYDRAKVELAEINTATAA